jgi:single-stranded DNA-specific DHH superfamily exonuclease
MKDSDVPTNNYEYRNGNFLSIFFATMGPNAGADNRNEMTKYGVYPIGGKYDDGNGGRVTLADATGIAPHKMITYAALKFMLTELVLAGETTGDARTLLSEGISEAIDHIHSVVDENEKANNSAPKISAEDRAEYIDAILAKYDAANAEGKMRIVMTQKWIHNFMNPIDAYTDYRRTGYPVLFNPNNTQEPGYGVNPSGDTEKSDARVELSTPASYPRSLYYPTNSETELNPNMPQKNDVSVPLVFWDK